MLFPDYEILKAKYPNYDYSFVTNGQVNPSDLPLPYKAILDCGYMRESFGSTTFRELMGSSLFGGVENILAGVPSFNMAFDEALKNARQTRNIPSTINALCILTYCASGVQDSQKVINMVDEFLSIGTMTGMLTDDECALLQFTLRNRETRRELQSQIEALKGRGTMTTDDDVEADKWNDVGWNYHTQGQFEKAIECFRKCLDLKPDHALAMNNMGLSKFRLGRFREAIGCFDEAIRISPNFVKPYSNKGIVLGEMGDKRGAEQWFKKALQIDPSYVRAREGLEKYCK